jgi:hypothetical protein
MGAEGLLREALGHVAVLQCSCATGSSAAVASSSGRLKLPARTRPPMNSISAETLDDYLRSFMQAAYTPTIDDTC